MGKEPARSCETLKRVALILLAAALSWETYYLLQIVENYARLQKVSPTKLWSAFTVLSAVTAAMFWLKAAGMRHRFVSWTAWIGLFLVVWKWIILYLMMLSH